MVSEIKTIDFIATANALEALVLEAKLIKEKNPPYNIREKDDKSFLYVEITDEEFPRVMLVRGKAKSAGERFGPFTSSGAQERR
jgi:excinuclease ABC subunit C